VQLQAAIGERGDGDVLERRADGFEERDLGRRCARHEAGDLIQAHAAGVATWDKVSELGALLAGSGPARASPSEITLFKSIGSALEDVAIAALAYGRLQLHAVS